MWDDLLDCLVGTKPDKESGIELPDGKNGYADWRGFNSVISKDIDREGAVIFGCPRQRPKIASARLKRSV